MKSFKPTILIIDNSPAITGAYKSIHSTTEALQNQFSFFFALSSHHLVSELLNKGKKAKYIPFQEIQKSWKILLYFPILIINCLRIQRIINTSKIQIIHVNDLYNMSGLLLKIFNPGIKVIYHIRLLPSSYANKFYTLWKFLIEKYADNIICVSETVAANFSKKKINVIFDSFAPSNLNKKEVHKQVKGTFNILYLANYIPGKGHKQAIQVVHLLKSQISNAQLTFHGGTLGKGKNEKFKDYLVNYVRNHGLTNYIKFRGFAKYPGQEIINSDLMLNFSESESFSMTTLEALAFGTPIVATRCGGPSEIVEDGISGILVEINDIQAMKQAILKLYYEPSLRKDFILSGKKQFKVKFNFNTQVSKLNNIYSNILNK